MKRSSCRSSDPNGIQYRPWALTRLPNRHSAGTPLLHPGMNKLSHVYVHARRWSVAETSCSGSVRVKGCSSEVRRFGAWGPVVIEQNASRAAASREGFRHRLGGRGGTLSAFHGPGGDAGRLPAMPARIWGDSLYESRGLRPERSTAWGRRTENRVFRILAASPNC